MALTKIKMASTTKNHRTSSVKRLAISKSPFKKSSFIEFAFLNHNLKPFLYYLKSFSAICDHFIELCPLTFYSWRSKYHALTLIA